MTRTEFNIAIGVRDFHNRRVGRFAAGKPFKDEDPRDLVRSLLTLDAVADFLGDGVVPDVPDRLLWVVKSFGYVRSGRLVAA